MFGLGKIKQYAAREGMADIESWLVGSSLRFAAEITHAFAEVPQVLAAGESLAVVQHALRRETYRASEFKVWDAVFEPSMKQMYQLFAMTLNAWANSDIDRSRLAADVQNLVSTRNLEYQTLPFLYSPVEDRQTVVYAAARHLAEPIDPARRDDVMAAAQKLYARFIEFDLPHQVEALSKALYGRSISAA